MASETFSSSTTWECPPDVTRIRVECWGAGAAGGYSSSSNGGSGGGGGAYSSVEMEVFPGNFYDIVVGIGSTPAAGSFRADQGGPSYFQDVFTCYAEGGYGGYSQGSDAAPAGGAGGLASAGVGDIKYSGGAGGIGGNNGGATDRVGAGGAGAGRSVNGASATYTAPGPFGDFGVGVDGGGDGGPANFDDDGNGFIPGGGGGSGVFGGTGNGADGRVDITYIIAGEAELIIESDCYADGLVIEPTYGEAELIIESDCYADGLVIEPTYGQAELIIYTDCYADGLVIEPTYGQAELPIESYLDATGLILRYVNGIAALSSTSNLTSQAKIIHGAKSNIVVVTNITPLGGYLIEAAAQLDDTSSFTAVGSIYIFVVGEVSLQVDSTITAAPVFILGGRTNLSITSTVNAFASLTIAGKADLLATSNIDALGGFLFQGITSINGSVSLDAIGSYLLFGQANLSINSDISADVIMTLGAESNLVLDSALTALASKTIVAQATLSCDSFVEASLSNILFGQAILACTSTIHPLGGFRLLGVASMDGICNTFFNGISVSLIPNNPPLSLTGAVSKKEKEQFLTYFYDDAEVAEVTYDILTDDVKSQIEVVTNFYYKKDDAISGSSTLVDNCQLGRQLRSDTSQYTNLYIAFPLFGIVTGESDMLDLVQGFAGSLGGDYAWIEDKNLCGKLTTNYGNLSISEANAITVLNNLNRFSISFNFRNYNGNGYLAKRDDSWQINILNGKLQTIVTTNSDSTLLSQKKITNNVYYNLVFTWDGEAQSVYLDSLPWGSLIHPDPGSISSSFGIDVAGFNGEIRDFRVYNEVLPLSTIRAINRNSLNLYS